MWTISRLRSSSAAQHLHSLLPSPSYRYVTWSLHTKNARGLRAVLSGASRAASGGHHSSATSAATGVTPREGVVPAPAGGVKGGGSVNQHLSPSTQFNSSSASATTAGPPMEGAPNLVALDLLEGTMFSRCGLCRTAWRGSTQAHREGGAQLRHIGREGLSSGTWGGRGSGQAHREGGAQVRHIGREGLSSGTASSVTYSLLVCISAPPFLR